jgi:acetylglutamate kinase
MGKEKATELDTMYVRAHTLIEALPYIQQFHKKIIVIKYGGTGYQSDA